MPGHVRTCGKALSPPVVVQTLLSPFTREPRTAGGCPHTLIQPPLDTAPWLIDGRQKPFVTGAAPVESDDGPGLHRCSWPRLAGHPEPGAPTSALASPSTSQAPNAYGTARTCPDETRILSRAPTNLAFPDNTSITANPGPTR